MNRLHVTFLSSLVLASAACSSSSSTSGGTSSSASSSATSAGSSGTGTTSGSSNSSSNSETASSSGTGNASGTASASGTGNSSGAGSSSGACGPYKGTSSSAAPDTCTSGKGELNAGTSLSNAGGSYLAVADLDGDGNVDYVEGAGGAQSVTVYFGKGNGTFEAGVTVSEGDTSQTISGGLAVGDFNADGLPDIASSGSAGNVYVWLNNGGRTFGSPPNQGASSTFVFNEEATQGLNQLIAVDLNNDGQVDLAMDGPSVAMSDCGVFSGAAQVALPSGVQVTWLALAKLNKHTYADLVVQGTVASGQETLVLFGNGNGTFQSAATPIADDGFFVAIGDVNNDGLPDLVLDNPGNDDIGVLLASSSGTFGQETKTFPLTGIAEESLIEMALIDVNNDGKLDVVQNADQVSPELAIALGNGDGTFQTETDVSESVTGLQFSIAVGDFNNSGLESVLAANLNSQTTLVSATCQ